MSTRRSNRLSAVTPAMSLAQTEKSSVGRKRKASAREIEAIKDVEASRDADAGKDADASASTPRKKRQTKAALPPVTPTPAAIGLMALPYSSGDIDDSTPPPAIDRLALPQGTNAPLVTPETHRLVANQSMDEVSPSKGGKSTTTTILEEAIAHLIKVEPKLKPVVEKHHCRVFSPEGLAEEIDPFRALVSGIISQQVSGAAAKSIKAKFVALFNPLASVPSEHSFPTPSQVLASSIEKLRPAGLSQRKAEYIYGLAEKFHGGEITTKFLFEASYDQVLEELVKVRGLGKWSVEMFACFGLKRLDVFSTGDLGVQRGMAALEGRDVEALKRKGAKNKWKYMSEQEMIEIAEKFRPYRSVARS